MTLRAAIFATLSAICTTASVAAEDTRQGALSDRIRSLQVEVEGVAMAPPIINLGAGDRIVISFDELAEDRSYLRYSLTHCNADWQPSQLVELEYLDGFNQADVRDYQYSRGTTTHYVHYQITIPDEQMRPLVSGNYLLRLWDEDNPDEILLQARFMVNEGGVNLGADVTSLTDIDYNDRHQQLSLVLETQRGAVADPFNDLIVKVTQNGREDNAAWLSHPLRVAGTRSYYEHMPSLIFPAGNEYRRFETVSVTYPGMGVSDITYHDPYYHFTLYTDEPRNELPYSYDQTQHGRYKVREYNSAASDIEADYGVVHFTLAMPQLPGYDIFIDGDMVNRRFDPESRMVYNRATGLYERSMLLKQGSYNYQYVAVPSGATRGETAPIEGDFFPTVNEYTVTVYNRPPGARYDRLVGALRILSGH